MEKAQALLRTARELGLMDEATDSDTMLAVAHLFICGLVAGKNPDGSCWGVPVIQLLPAFR